MLSGGLIGETSSWRCFLRLCGPSTQREVVAEGGVGVQHTTAGSCVAHVLSTVLPSHLSQTYQRTRVGSRCLKKGARSTTPSRWIRAAAADAHGCSLRTHWERNTAKIMRNVLVVDCHSLNDHSACAALCVVCCVLCVGCVLCVVCCVVVVDDDVVVDVCCLLVVGCVLCVVCCVLLLFMCVVVLLCCCVVVCCLLLVVCCLLLFVWCVCVVMCSVCVHGVCVCVGVCGVGGVCTVAWCVQVKRMIGGIGNVLCSTNCQTVYG